MTAQMLSCRVVGEMSSRGPRTHRDPPGGRPTRTRLTEEVARRLLVEIRKRGLTPGMRIPSERELITVLGVGRSTIREVVNGLAMLGALEIRHGQGAFVRDAEAGLGAPHAIAAVLARGVTEDLFEARRLVEAHTTRLAAERHCDQDLVELDELLCEHERTLAAGRPAAGDSARFHVRLAASGANEMLARAVECIAAPPAGPGMSRDGGDRFPGCDPAGHRQILRAVRRRDAEDAAQLMLGDLEAIVTWYRRAHRVGLISDW